MTPPAGSSSAIGIGRIVIPSVVLLLFLLPVLLKPSHFIHDDSYFYLQVSRNIAQGAGSTFHQITPTNGYHPLWMLVCVVGYLLSGGATEAHLRVIVLAQAALTIGACHFLRRSWSLLSRRGSTVGLALLAGFLLSTALYASEAHLNAFLLTAAVYRVLLAVKKGALMGFTVVGLLLALAILARLDNVFVAGSLLAVTLWYGHTGRDGRQIRGVATAALTTSVIVAPYLLYNLLSYGHAVPISGYLKSTFPLVVGEPGNLGTLGQITAVSALAAIVWGLTRKADRDREILFVGLGGGVLGHAAYVVMFTDHYTFWSWYYVSGVVCMAFLGCEAAARARLRFERLGWSRAARSSTRLATAALLVLGIGYGWMKALNPEPGLLNWLPRRVTEYRWQDELAVWMKGHFPEGTAVLAYDYPGALAYYSGMRILPTDGLMSDFAYSEDLRALGLEGYLCAKGVGLFFGPVVFGGESFGPRGAELRAEKAAQGIHVEVPTPLFDSLAGTLYLQDRNLEVRVREIVRLPEEAPDLAIWKLGLSCSQPSLAAPDSSAARDL